MLFANNHKKTPTKNMYFQEKKSTMKSALYNQNE